MKKITGGQIFSIPQDKVNKLIAYKNYLTAKQKQDILNAIQSGSGVEIKATNKQIGSGFGTILASLGIPFVIEASKKLLDVEKR